MSIRPGIVPCLVYDDAPAAIEFLCAAFGFTRHLIVPGDAGQIMHAQLTLGDACMVMLSSATPRSREQFRMVSPVSTGGLVTATICVTLAEPRCASCPRRRGRGEGLRCAARQRLWRPRLRGLRHRRQRLELCVLRSVDGLNFVLSNQ
jgi:uncharacterized glyoxalase superfamily protein PhnB